MVTGLALLVLAGACRSPAEPAQKPLSWRLYQCTHGECILIAAFVDQELCQSYEQLFWSQCDPAAMRVGKLWCELMDVGKFETFTRCTQEVLRWDDVADGGRWSF